MPGTTDYRLMFPMRWSLIDDHFEFCLASSPDNIVWGWAPGGPVCVPGAAGSWDGGVVLPSYGLVSLPRMRTGMSIEGSPVPHKHPRRPPLGALGWAWWPEDRLVALKAKEEGSFALYPLLFEGRTVHLNFQTVVAGYVQVEAVGADGQVLPGRSFEDCDRLCGDHLGQVMSWRGETDLGYVYLQNHADGYNIRSLTEDLDQTCGPALAGSRVKLYVVARQWVPRSEEAEAEILAHPAVSGLVFSTFRHDNPEAIARGSFVA